MALLPALGQDFFPPFLFLWGWGVVRSGENGGKGLHFFQMGRVV